MYYFLAKLWCVVSMVLIVVEEANGGGLVVAELKGPKLGGTKTVGAKRLCLSSGDALVEAEVPLLLFLDLGLLRAFGQQTRWNHVRWFHRVCCPSLCRCYFVLSFFCFVLYLSFLL